jgi:hypothetical protein
MKLIAELEGNKDAVLAALQQAGVKIVNIVEIATVNFGATKSCPNRGKSSGLSDRWVIHSGDSKTCSECGTFLEKKDEYTCIHPESGEIPDYGQPESIPVGSKLGRYDKMECDCGRIFLGAFCPDGRLIAAKEIVGEHHKNGKWSYSELSVVVPDTCVLLCVTRSTHSNSANRRYLKFKDKETFIGKLTELDRLPDAASISQQLGVTITSECLERIALYRALFAARQRWAELKGLTGIQTF